MNFNGNDEKENFRGNADEKQFGFKKSKGTRNAIFELKITLKRSLEMEKDVKLCFVDFQKAFDTNSQTNV